MHLPAIADLLAAPPDGFLPAHASSAAGAFAAPFGRDVVAFWAQCTRADWMLHVAGWCAAPPRPMVAVACAQIRVVDQAMGLLDAAQRAELDLLAAFGEDPRVQLPAHDPDPQPPAFVEDPSWHFLRQAIEQTYTIARGPLVGPSYPMVCGQTALYAARAVGGGGPPDLACLERHARALRERVPPPALPDAIPSSWAAAVAGEWAKHVERAASGR